METGRIIVRVADTDDQKYAKMITEEMESSARLRGSGISGRSPESLKKKMGEGHAVIAVTVDGTWVGFSYMEVWANGEFVSNSGLIVAGEFRNKGVAKAIKKEIFSLCREKYPRAKIFSITTGLAIMKMNTQLGFETVTFSEIAGEKKFWEGCRSCVNYNILKSKGCKNCLCTAMLYSPKEREKSEN